MFSYRERELKNPRDDNRDRDRSPLPRRGLPETTNDPNTVTARIFVGSIVVDIPREAMHKHFSKWGTVTGVSITKHNFGFVQFSSPSEAQDCLADGHFTMLNGLKLDVKPAKIGPNPSNTAVPATPPTPGGNWPARPTGRVKFPERDTGYHPDREYPSARRENYYVDYYKSEQSKRQNFESTDSYRSDYYRDYYDRERERGRDRESGNGYYYSSSTYQSENRSSISDIYSSQTPDPLDPSRPNDVEIVVPNKLQRGYAERIEGRLKGVGLLVDLLFPPSDIPSHQVLNDLSSRRCLFAIFITPDNEKHNSLTLNILHGETQEHRNMPVEDALQLVQQNFDGYVKKCSQLNMRQVIPRDIRNLLHDLIEMRTLSMGDLDKLIKYLKERQNSLVDDQIEQKRETAGTQTTAIARSMAVTYPGYNYLTTVSDTPASHTTMGAPVLTAAVPTASVGIVQTAPTAVAAATAQTYPTYGTVSALAPATVMNAYSITGAQLSANPATGIITGAAAVPDQQVQNKQNELQERILSLMKTQGGLQVTGVSAPAPPPVPPPAGVPPPRMLHTTTWPTVKPDVCQKLNPGNQAVYNPWTQ